MQDDVYTLDRVAETPAPPEYADDVGDLHFVPAPCQVACPVGTDVPSYLAYIWEERWEEAFEAITATNPLSSICARVCDAPCEPACRRAQSDGPLGIRNLKRVVMDRLGAGFRPAPHPVSRREKIAIVGAGPAGLAAAQDLASHGFAVDIYEASDRAGGMAAWGIPGFRLPPERIGEDIARLQAQCPGIRFHFNTALGDGVTLPGLKASHDAVLLTIGAFAGKPMGVPGEAGNPLVVDGVGFLRQINGGARPQLPETVVVIGGGDVAMDACRAALRMPGCERVKVVYRRGPEEIPARREELEGAVEEGVEFLYNTQQERIAPAADGSLRLHCLRTEMGAPDPVDGRRRPQVVAGSEHVIDCGMVIAAVGQKTDNAHLAGLGLMRRDRVETDWQTMRTAEDKVFAAGDGAFGGSTIVTAMSHGQRAAYYIRQFLDGVTDPIPYRTPHHTRRVPVAQDIMWERYPRHEQAFHGLGDDPAGFSEIESSYPPDIAHAEAARCYRCDAETGCEDYSVHAREDIFSMARTTPGDMAKLRAMLDKRLVTRANPFPPERPATLDDLVFLPANLSRLVIDPYREACRFDTDLMGAIDLPNPFFAAGMDAAPEQVFRAMAQGVARADAAYLGTRDPGGDLRWFQLVDGAASAAASAVIHDASQPAEAWQRARQDQLLGLRLQAPGDVPRVVPEALAAGCEFLLLDATGSAGGDWPELAGPPDLTLLRDTIATLRALRREEHIDLIWFGGARSGTDGAKLIAQGVKVVAYGVPVALAAGGRIAGPGIAFDPGRSIGDIADAVANLLKAHLGEATMMARCTGKTRLHNLEPEDLRSITLATREATAIPISGQNS